MAAKANGQAAIRVNHFGKENVETVGDATRLVTCGYQYAGNRDVMNVPVPKDPS